MSSRALAWALAAIALLILGSCSRVPLRSESQTLPPDLDAYLAAREANVPGLIPGDESMIAWAGEAGQRTRVSLVYLHGWQGSPHDYDPVLRTVGGAMGANIYYARLKGYGVTTDEVASVTVNDWLNDAWEALRIGRRLGDRVVVAGSSMGGNLALWLATQNQPELAALVLLSCAIEVQDTRAAMLLWPWPLPQLISRLVVGKYNVVRLDTAMYPTANPELFARLNPPQYRSESTIKLMQVIRFTRALPLQSLGVPQVWLYSENDDAVDIRALKRCYERVDSTPKRLVEVAGAHAHMLAGDIFSPETSSSVSAEIVAFLRYVGIGTTP